MFFMEKRRYPRTAVILHDAERVSKTPATSPIPTPPCGDRCRPSDYAKTMARSTSRIAEYGDDFPRYQGRLLPPSSANGLWRAGGKRQLDVASQIQCQITFVGSNGRMPTGNGGAL
jgi:hypothetical protein